jgi:hypothetical protein
VIESDEGNPIVSGRQNIYVHNGDTKHGRYDGFGCPRAYLWQGGLQIVLVFGLDQKLRDRLVKRFYTYP